jgi:hypothetical protein
MDGIIAGFLGSLGTVSFFGFCAFAVWIDYRKKKDERDAAHQERMKALEMGHPPFDAEIARAKAYASAAWAAGVIGLVLPIVVIVGAVAATIVAIFELRGENIAGPLITAWIIAAIMVLATVIRCLATIRQLPRPTADPPTRSPATERRVGPASSEFHEKRLEL